MSPMAVGTPHTRTFSVGSSQPIHTMPAPKPNGFGDQKTPSRVIPHLDDLVVAKPDVDIKSPLRTILQRGDTLARQADTHLDFRRPDLALQEYVSASEIAVEIIPRHPDYLALQKDRGELYRLYSGLTKRINTQHDKFAEVKSLIKADNVRSGVKPVSRTVNTDENISRDGPSQRPTIRSELPEKTNSYTVTSSSKKKPAPIIQPKPDALHGKAILPTDGTSDLATRFARLQNGGPVQDPRINTRPIRVANLSTSNLSSSIAPYGNGHTMIRPAGPRDIPASSSAKPSLANSLPISVSSGMPRAPDAIHHSPLRTNENHGVDAVNLPSSVSRHASYLGSARKNSAPPISTVGPSPYLVNEDRVGYFTSPTHSSHDHHIPITTGKRDLPPPDATTITADALYKFLNRGQQVLKILIVDLRNRQEFDSGHIMSQSIICVDPITLRDGMSGEELSDSMILAPSSEQSLFERRKDFDLLVFYDQSSTFVKTSNLGQPNDGILKNFAAAVYEFGYEKQLKQRPVLLSGGLDAWVDLLGPNSLKASDLANGSQKAAASRAISAKSLSVLRREALSAAKKKVPNTRLRSRNEEDEWNAVMRQDMGVTDLTNSTGSTSSEELPYARTQDEFLRRFPELPVQESMTSARPRSLKHRIEDPLPRPPTRPAPALPRQRSSGITEKGPSLRFAQPAGPSTTTLPYQVGLTGLTNNTGADCYLNSAIQLIGHSQYLRQILLAFRQGSIIVPQKAGETSPPPQLMTLGIGNVLTHMWSGRYEYLNPVTLKGYINAVHTATGTDSVLYNDRGVHRTYREISFGARKQHDSGEFLVWLWQIIMDELNIKRDFPKRDDPPTFTRELGALAAGLASKRFWDYYKDQEESRIINEMAFLESTVRTCSNCGTRTRFYTCSARLGILVNDPTISRTTLESLIRSRFGQGSREFVNVRCEVCYVAGSTKDDEGHPMETFSWLGRMPRTLWIALDRGNKFSLNRKVGTIVTFPEQLDLTEYFDGDGLDDDEAPEYKGPFIYDVVSVVMHYGPDQHSGHYVNYSKVYDASSGTSSWWKFNDSNVQQAPGNDIQTGTATWLCLERAGRPTP